MPDTTNNANAGAPVRLPAAAQPAAAQPAGGGRPSAAELDAREREKAQPRRPAGPPLTSSTAGAAAAPAPPHNPPPPTDP
jgi:hypothetical protein